MSLFAVFMFHVSDSWICAGDRLLSAMDIAKAVIIHARPAQPAKRPTIRLHRRRWGTGAQSEITYATRRRKGCNAGTSVFLHSCTTSSRSSRIPGISRAARRRWRSRDPSANSGIAVRGRSRSRTRLHAIAAATPASSQIQGRALILFNVAVLTDTP